MARTLLAPLAIALLGCGGEGPAPPAGAKLFQTQGCVACHGAGGEGGALGPPLRELATHWTRERLVAYLADPAAVVAGDPRLRELGKAYMVPMPPIRAPASDRAALADYVLSLD
jgi:mono/diheme cytochrome c family protein